jgi:outer membrane lipoprotein-sorting protein
MFKLFCIGILCASTLSACEQQKQASAEVGAVPKEILDKAKNHISDAEALAAEQTKALEGIEAPADETK